VKVYVASSWRNLYQPGVVGLLRRYGHEVYDFRHPVPGNDGFSWRETGHQFGAWSGPIHREALNHPVAVQGYGFDMAAMKWADACVLVLPAGRSASFELGWCMGAGKLGVVFIPEPVEPELMWREARIVVDPNELLAALEALPASPPSDPRPGAETVRDGHKHSEYPDFLWLVTCVKCKRRVPSSTLSVMSRCVTCRSCAAAPQAEPRDDDDAVNRHRPGGAGDL
jgi:hypothetical protein